MLCFFFGFLEGIVFQGPLVRRDMESPKKSFSTRERWITVLYI